MKQQIQIMFDGCCEPRNPGGHMGIGVAAFVDGEPVWEFSEHYPPDPGNSNNLAEYLGLLEALNWLVENNYELEDIKIYGDSKLVINQMQGLWKINGGRYEYAAKQARKAYNRNFSQKPIDWYWIPRDENGIADELSKKPLLDRGVEFRIQPQ